MSRHPQAERRKRRGLRAKDARTERYGLGGGQGAERRPLLGKHRRHLAFGGAVNARVGPVCLPAIEISLGFLQGLKALALEWRFLRMAHPGFNLTFAIRIAYAAGHGYHAIVGQQIAIERIELGVVDVGLDDDRLRCAIGEDTGNGRDHLAPVTWRKKAACRLVAGVRVRVKHRDIANE